MSPVAELFLVARGGRLGESYNIESGAEMANIDLIGMSCDDQSPLCRPQTVW